MYDWVERTRPDLAGPKVVVLAPQYGATWIHVSGLARIGTWVFEWQRPHPDLRDDLVILHDAPGLEAIVRRQFPDRRLYRMVLLTCPPFGVILPLDPKPDVPALPYGAPRG